MKHFKRASLLLALAVLFALQDSRAITGQDSILQGPILVTQFVENIDLGGQVTFQDVGTGRVWQFQTSALLYETNIWTPDGCKVILSKRSKDSVRFFSLSISELTLEELPPLGRPLWSPDGQSVVFISQVTENQVGVYLTDLSGQNPELVITVRNSEWTGDVHWLSSDQLFYDLWDGRKFIWSRITRRITPLGELQFKLPEYEEFYTSRTASNREIVAIFADLSEYRSAGNPFIQELTESDIATLEAEKPTMRGFDLFFLNDGTTRHIDVNGQFIFTLEWSPASHRIAITTDYKGDDFGIYAYDLETEKLQRIAAAYIEEGFPYFPTWSQDENRLAFRTPEGYFIQSLSDGKRIQLDERMNGSRLYWSPVMDYSDSPCSKDD